MWQRSRSFGFPPVGHQPARNRNGDGYKSQQGGDYQCYDETDLGDADLLFDGVARSQVHPRLLPPLYGEDSIRGYSNLLPQLSSVYISFNFSLARSISSMPLSLEASLISRRFRP